jgi:hypothetical protein
MASLISIATSGVQEVPFFYILTTIFIFVAAAIDLGVKSYLIVAFICISLLISVVIHLFTC